MSRYALAGVGAGVTINTAFCVATAHPVDAGIELTKEQKTKFAEAGYEPTPVASVAPEVPERIAPPDEVAQGVIAANSAAAERLSDQTLSSLGEQVAGDKDRAKKTADQSGP